MPIAVYSTGKKPTRAGIEKVVIRLVAKKQWF
jgi:hypothetical protein